MIDRPALDVDIYRLNSLDLRDLDDAALAAHFAEWGFRERRIYAATQTTVETMSMRWLRGRGMEVGAGRNPTPLFGNASCLHADISTNSFFGGAPDIVFDLNGDGFADPNAAGDNRFDFVIAAHVLEHCDSFIRSLSNLLETLNDNGVAYLVLPDRRYLHDETWLPEFDFNHHLTEWKKPLAYADLHDRQFLAAFTTNVRHNDHAEIDEVTARAMETGKMPAERRSLTHKHNYRYADWIDLMIRSLATLKSPFVIEDTAFGRERMDCHFVLGRR